MPVKGCSRKGKKGKKWGDSGKCYAGRGAESRAKKQGRAIKSSQRKR